jgi:hypothetical protein
MDGVAILQRGSNRMATQPHTTWPELAIDLYDKLTGCGAEITYEFQNLEVSVPSGTSREATYATWKLNGR